MVFGQYKSAKTVIILKNVYCIKQQTIALMNETLEGEICILAYISIFGCSEAQAQQVMRIVVVVVLVGTKLNFKV